jgi:hypothetical protein
MTTPTSINPPPAAPLDQPSNDRWWENYYVRYFVGTVVGVVVVLAFRSFALTAGWFDGIIPDLEELTGGDVALVIGLGLAYCYIASTPVLVLHATRGGLSLRGKWPKSFKRFLISIPFVLLLAYWVFASDKSTCRWFGWTLILCFAVLQLIALKIAARNDFDETGIFFKNLLVARHRNKLDGFDFVDSYKHLREHGNAVLIVICEIALGVALAVMQSVSEIVVALVIWLLPAAATWFFGSIFEAKFAHMQGNWELEEDKKEKKPTKW